MTTTHPPKYKPHNKTQTNNFNVKTNKTCKNKQNSIHNIVRVCALFLYKNIIYNNNIQMQTIKYNKYREKIY